MICGSGFVGNTMPRSRWAVLPMTAAFELSTFLSPRSRGCCWARSQYASRYEGEDFVLQLNSHHRFIEEWDAVLIDMMARVPSRKAILTTYPPAYNPEGQREEWPTTMEFVAFTAQGTIVMNHRPMANFADLNSPIPSRFLAGGFSFSAGTIFARRSSGSTALFPGRGSQHVCARIYPRL